MARKIPLFDIYWDEDDVNSVSDIIKRGTYWADGPEIKQFENALSKFFNMNHVAVFNSGTSALHSALLGLDINSGEVIVPSFTFISTANAVILAGAKPVFAEIEDKSLGLDFEDVEKKINSNTRAIIAVHYGGRVCKEILKLRELAEKKGIKLIEDNAESFGAKIDNQYTGTIGDAGILSFCQNKILPTGEGGAVITNDEKLYERLLLIRSHGRVEKKDVSYFENTDVSDYIEVGYNYRMPTICAALGLSQLSKIDNIISLRRKVGKLYDKKLSLISEIKLLMDPPNIKSVYQFFTILLEDPSDRNELQKYLLQNNIYTKIYFAPIHLKSFYKKRYNFNYGDLPITEEISSKVLTLPMSLNFSNSEIDFISKKINFFYKQK